MFYEPCSITERIFIKCLFIEIERTHFWMIKATEIAYWTRSGNVLTIRKCCWIFFSFWKTYECLIQFSIFHPLRWRAIGNEIDWTKKIQQQFNGNGHNLKWIHRFMYYKRRTNTGFEWKNHSKDVSLFNLSTLEEENSWKRLNKRMKKTATCKTTKHRNRMTMPIVSEWIHNEMVWISAWNTKWCKITILKTIHAMCDTLDTCTKETSSTPTTTTMTTGKQASRS